jgi:hypothetical protein
VRKFANPFRGKIQELTTPIGHPGEAVTIDITDETIEASLNAIAQMVFLFKALEPQK